MSRVKRNRINGCRGFTVLELLIAAFITAVLATASFRFYSSMHNQTETQYEVSELQHQCRASIHEIKKTLRLAGFKLTGHPAVEIRGDTLAIYFKDTQPVDTVKYFLQEFDTYEYARVPNLPEGQQLFNLVKQHNGQTPESYTNFLRDIEFQVVDTRTIKIIVMGQVAKQDDTFTENGGFRTWSLEEQVSLRNVHL